jgi:hypothetical protein
MLQAIRQLREVTGEYNPQRDSTTFKPRGFVVSSKSIVTGYLLLLGCLYGCDPKPAPIPKSSPTVATDPHATDSLARLMRLFLTTDKAFGCLSADDVCGVRY